jgi:hypothetical protein
MEVVLRLDRIIVCALVGALSLPLPAQQASGASKLVDQSKATLKINVLEGEGAKNSIRARTAAAPVVEVKDAADKPVVGAEVIFQLPAVGPSGIFNGWLKSQTVRTDEQGKASATGYTPNGESGRFNIKVTATLGTQTGQAIIAQANVDGDGTSGGSASKKSGTWKYVLGIGGAAAVIAAVAATRGGTSTATTVAAIPVSITAGGITVAGPR